MSQTLTTLTPHIVCRNAAEAIAFYQKAFGAEVITQLTMPDGVLIHGAISINGANLYLVDEMPSHGVLGPQSVGHTTVGLHLQVPDCDAVFARATEAGCTVVMPLAEMFWGDRYGQLEDPYGHRWSVATTVRQVSPADLQGIAEAMAAEGAGCGQG